MSTKVNDPSRSLTFTYQDLLDYDFPNKYLSIHSSNLNRITKFSLESEFFSYEIDQVGRRGLLNYIYVSSCRSLDELTPNPHTILSGFDLNSCQVAIDLKTKRIFYTFGFLRFLSSLQMEIVCPSKPYQTMIRYFSKKDQFKYYGNDDLAIEIISTYKAIEDAFKEEFSPFHNQYYSEYEDIGVPHELKNFKIGKFGERYANKYKSLHSMKSSFDLRKHKLKFEPTKFGSEMFAKKGLETPKNVILNSLTPRHSGSEYILSGKHREELEKRLNTPVVNYATVCLSTLPIILKEHYRLSRGASVVNKWESISKHLDRAEENKFKSMSLRQGFNDSAESYASNYSPKLLSQISKITTLHPNFERAFRDIPHEVQKSRLDFIKQLEIDNLDLMYRAENCCSINWNIIDNSSYKEACKHIRSVAARERVQGDILCKPDFDRSFDFKNFRVTQLCRQSELKQESKAMHHCVRTYSNLVQSGISRIFSFTADDGERATLELNGKKYPFPKERQFRTKFNLRPSRKMISYKNEFISHFNALIEETKAPSNPTTKEN
ncbi:PcfJ domain-containing protein [Vibrio sp. D431a]|uniref:PcfJ domain-containing protein n=1 Tax=Vibrio sp. D431a TaxID=2837388 RepID=UPI002552222A|nr:PcfJ domain-containing protein [Vibrio sp. D431a]